MNLVSALIEPKPATLKRYGLTLEDWRIMVALQGGACYVCRKVPTTGRLVIDHEHRPRWKHQPPAERRKAVRGALCWFCNKNYVGRCITVEKARRVVEYLERHMKVAA